MCVCGSTIRFTNLQTNIVCLDHIIDMGKKLTDLTVWKTWNEKKNVKKKIFFFGLLHSSSSILCWMNFSLCISYHWHFFWLYFGYRQWFMILKERKKNFLKLVNSENFFQCAFKPEYTPTLEKKIDDSCWNTKWIFFLLLVFK